MNSNRSNKMNQTKFHLLFLGLLGVMFGSCASASGQTNSQKVASLPSLEIIVELAWLADPELCRYYPRAVFAHDTLIVAGELPSESHRARALAIAKRLSKWPLMDRFKIHANVAIPAVSLPSDQLLRSAALVLKSSFPQECKVWKVGYAFPGQVIVSGNVDSWRKKLMISQKLRQLPGCLCVKNLLAVAGSPSVPTIPPKQIVSPVRSHPSQKIPAQTPSPLVKSQSKGSPYGVNLQKTPTLYPKGAHYVRNVQNTRPMPAQKVPAPVQKPRQSSPYSQISGPGVGNRASPLAKSTYPPRKVHPKVAKPFLAPMNLSRPNYTSPYGQSKNVASSKRTAGPLSQKSPYSSPYGRPQTVQKSVPVESPYAPSAPVGKPQLLMAETRNQKPVRQPNFSPRSLYIKKSVSNPTNPT